MDRGHKEWDAMPHAERIKCVATIIAVGDKRGFQSLCREEYMSKWLTDYMDELLNAIAEGETYV